MHFAASIDVFLILVAMERLDTRACEALAPQVGGAPVFSSDNFDMYQIVSILRCSSLMVSSRYHAMVTSMPGLVPSAGVTMDERIRNLLRERGHEHLLLTVDDADLGERLAGVMERLAAEADAVRDGIGRSVVRNLKTMARMGMYPRARRSSAISGISGALRRARLGRIFAAAQPESCRACWTLTKARRLPRPETRLRISGNLAAQASQAAEKLATVIPKGEVCPRNLLLALFCGKADPSLCSG